MKKRGESPHLLRNRTAGSEKPLCENHAYYNRTIYLRSIGFDSYPDYLASDLWRSIRNRVLKRDQGRCLICGLPADTVHHLSYQVPVLTGEDESKLASLCRKHHEQFEFRRGEKNTLAFANKKMEQRFRQQVRRAYWSVRRLIRQSHQHPARMRYVQKVQEARQQALHLLSLYEGFFGAFKWKLPDLSDNPS